MANRAIEMLWERRREILPGASEDEIQHAFTEALASPPGDGEGYIPLLREKVLEWRRVRSNQLANEMNWDALMIREHMDRWLEDVEEEMYVMRASSLDDMTLAEIVNSVLSRVDEVASQAFILLELRGVSLEEASGILWVGQEELATLAAGVAGLIRERLTR